MIEITHQQARRMLREAVDTVAPAEQWALLQAHLEGCAACRAYAAHLAGTERGLRRVLGARWNAPSAGWSARSTRVEAVSGAVTGYLQRRERARRGVRFVLGVLALALLVLVGIRRAAQPLEAPVAAAPTAAPTPTRTPTPDLPPGQFPFSVIYAGTDGEISLLTPGTDGQMASANLTGHPAQDTAPLWSPDGEWLAFLSDRGGPTGSGGKPEVYVMHIAGSRLTRLTDEPGIDWQGPLTWSADGAVLALTGRSRESGLDAVYLVSLKRGPGEESNVRRLGFTRGAPGRVRFSPRDPILAFASPPGEGGLTLYNFDVHWYLQPVWQDDQDLSLYIRDFDWSADGASLAYLAEGPYDQLDRPPPWIFTTSLKMTGIIDPRSTMVDSTTRRILMSANGTGRLRGVSVSPSQSDPAVAFSMDPDEDGCWTIVRAGVVPSSIRTLREAEGLCVDVPPDSGSWSPDGQWLVLLAHTPADPRPAIYALNMAALGPVEMPGGPGLPGVTPPPVERVLLTRLAEVSGPVEALAGILPGLLPQVRPETRQDSGVVRVGIDPLPAPPPPEPTARAFPPPPLSAGRIVYSVLHHWGRSLYLTNLAGSLDRRLTDDEGEFRCPALSPDARWLAYTTFTGGLDGRVEVFLKDLNLETPAPPERIATAENVTFFHCPVWSPDGEKLALAIANDEDAIYRLRIIPTGHGVGRSIAVAPFSYTAGPVWSPDGQSVFLAQLANDVVPSRIIRVPAEEGREDVSGPPLLQGRVDNALGMALSPDGSRLAVVTALEPAESREEPTALNLIMVSPQDGAVSHLLDLPAMTFNAYLGEIPMAWLPGGQIALFVRQQADARYKTDVALVDPGAGEPVRVVYRLPDVVYDAAWSPDGQWVAYTGDGGMYALYLGQFLALEAAEVQNRVLKENPAIRETVMALPHTQRQPGVSSTAGPSSKAPDAPSWMESQVPYQWLLEHGAFSGPVLLSSERAYELDWR